MIRNDSEHARALDRIKDEEVRFAAEEARLRQELQFTDDEIVATMEPLRSFHAQLVDEVRIYERLKRGDLGGLTNLRGVGRMLVHLRIARGLTQRELAAKLGVHESQVSRDERNEYHGVTLDRASKIMDAIGASVRTRVVLPEHERQAEWHPALKRAKEPVLIECTTDQGQTLTPTDKVKNADFAAAA